MAEGSIPCKGQQKMGGGARTGPCDISFETDTAKRRKKRYQRKKTLFKSAHHLHSICGGSVLIIYKDLNKKTFVYTNEDEWWQIYKDSGLAHTGAPSTRCDHDGETAESEHIEVHRPPQPLTPQAETTVASTTAFTDDGVIVLHHPTDEPTSDADSDCSFDPVLDDPHAVPFTTDLPSNSYSPPLKRKYTPAKVKPPGIPVVSRKTVSTPKRSHPPARPCQCRASFNTCFICKGVYSDKDKKGPWVACKYGDTCKNWGHFTCVGWGHLVGTNVDNKECICPDCSKCMYVFMS